MGGPIRQLLRWSDRDSECASVPTLRFAHTVSRFLSRLSLFMLVAGTPFRALSRARVVETALKYVR